MARPRTESPGVRRKKIVEAAREILVEKGYRDLGMSDVAQRAGIASGTLYLYFKDKRALVAAVFIELFDRLEERLHASRHPTSGLETLRNFAHEMLSFVDEHHDFLSQAPRPRPDWKQQGSGQKFRDRMHKHVDFLSRVLKDCMKEGTVRSYDPRLASLYFIGLGRMFMVNKVIAGLKAPLTRRVPTMMDLFLNGLGAKKEVARV